MWKSRTLPVFYKTPDESWGFFVLLGVYLVSLGTLICLLVVKNDGLECYCHAELYEASRCDDGTSNKPLRLPPKVERALFTFSFHYNIQVTKNDGGNIPSGKCVSDRRAERKLNSSP